MLAFRNLRLTVAPDTDEPWLPKHEPADWLTLQQAACELNVSPATVRRMIHRGELRNRVVPRRGGYAYLVYLPGSRHAESLAHPAHADRPANVTPIRPHADYRSRFAVDDAEDDDDSAENAGDKDRVIRELQQQVDRLSDALGRTLRIKQTALPAGMGETGSLDPYARYRWLVRKKRWWPF